MAAMQQIAMQPVWVVSDNLKWFSGDFHERR